jgi:hypothetical protein
VSFGRGGYVTEVEVSHRATQRENVDENFRRKGEVNL